MLANDTKITASLHFKYGIRRYCILIQATVYTFDILLNSYYRVYEILYSLLSLRYPEVSIIGNVVMFVGSVN